MEAMNCEKSDDAVKQPDNTVEESDNAMEPVDNIVEQPDNIEEQPDNTVEQPDDTVEQPDATVEQSESILQQSDSVMERSENAVEQMDTTEENPETSGNAISCTEDMDESVPMQVEDDEQTKNDNADLTVDINLDTQLHSDTHKDVTDEDVMHHLDVIENIELDPETFGIDKSTENDCQSITIKSEDEQMQDEVSLNGKEQNWYKKKVAEKETLVKERLSKLARVLGITYPHYEKWLERIEKKEGSPMCKLDSFRRCPLDKPHTNRWKFECVRKDIQVTAKEEEKSESSNKSHKTVWSLEPTSAWGVDINNTSEFPSFVLKAVKIFEDFLQTTITSGDDVAATSDENPSNDTSSDVDSVQKQMWMWLLVRCNSMDELMLFATGKNISRSTLDRLKQIYESGQGKDCNVKSLYCKSMNKCANNKIITNTTFLVGAEALDEVVGGLKVQLSPKTNFWSNAAGALNVAKAVMDMLKPTSKITILEIGCGIGVIGLMMASKCLEVIGVDSPSEIEEAEITCELNNITNASFIMGSPAEVVNKISAAVKNRVTFAIVNANTNMGRAVEVMTCLRKLTSLRRIVMVTTLTKQSVRAVLELARPIESGLGHPYMPTRACVVDTLPIGPHFEAVILMEHRLMHRLTQPWFLKILEEESKSLENTRALEKEINSSSIDSVDIQLRKNTLASVGAAKRSKTAPTKKTSPAKRTSPAKSGSSSPTKNKNRLKRENESSEVIEIPKKMTKKYDKPGYNKTWKQQDATAKKKNWIHDKSALRVNPLFDKKSKDKEQVDLRAKLSGSRIDTDLVQKVNESREILEAAKEKLSGPSPTVDATTAKELQNVLSLVLEQTNKLQNQLPRSVWDRIAPPETSQSSTAQVKNELDDDPLLKGRFVQETHAQDIVITTANKEYLDTEEVKPTLPYRKYHNIPPLEPDMVPVSLRNEDGKTKYYERILYNRNKQNQGNSWNKNKGFQKTRWGNAGTMRKPNSPIRKQNSPFRHRGSPPRRSSPKRPLQSPPRRPVSPPRRRLSSDRPVPSPSQSPYQGRNMHREFSPQKRPVPLMSASTGGGRRDMSPPRRSFSPSNQAMSPSRRPISPPRRPVSPMGRPMSPVQQMPSWRPISLSPPRRQMSPMRMYGSSTRQMSPMRRPTSPIRHRQMSPMRRQMSPQRRAMSPVDRMISPPRSRGTMPPRHQSPVRRPSPHRMPPGHEFSSPTRRQQSPPRRQSPPQNKFADDWDIPNRGAVEQGIWQHPVNERPSENIWRNERQPTTSSNWQPVSDNNDRYRKPQNQPLSDNDRYRKPQNQQDRPWNNRDSTSHGNSWGSKQPLAKPDMKEPWNQNSDNNRWSGPSRSGNNNDNWNIRGKDNMGGNREKAWVDSDRSRWEQPQSNDSWNQGDKDDWNDLPEDARDPWGDDGNLGLKDRWMNVDNQVVVPSNWSRDTDKADPWSKPKENWQNKSQAFSSKPPYQGNSNPNMNDSRWLAPNESNKKAPSTNWQGSSNSGTWQQSSGYNFQSQRSFNTSVFKDRR